MEKRRVWRIAAAACVAAPLVLLSMAAVSFALAKPVCETVLPVRAAHPKESHNLALYRYGPSVAASSANLSQFHHPTFAVDGMTAEPKTAKWVSDKADRAPWIEIRFREAHDVERVSFRFAGVRERKSQDMRRYTVRCLGPSPAQLSVRDNRESAPSHELRCSRASGVRIEFELRGNDVARVYEIEVMGR